MKKLCAALAMLILLFAGCSGNVQEGKPEAGEIDLKKEKLVKEFAGTVNIFHRAGDDLLLSTEEGEFFKYYVMQVDAAEVAESELTEMADRYVYYEPAGSNGFVMVEAFDYKNTLIFRGKDNKDTIIAEDIGQADTINISISPGGGKVAYTSLLEGTDVYGINIYDVKTSKSCNIMNIESDGLIEGFNYLIEWSPDENNVIIHDKYIYDANSGKPKGELKSAYSQWSPSGSKIAFILDDGSEPWLPTVDYQVYPGRKVCIYDLSTGSYDEVFKIDGDEYIFGSLTWGGKDSSLAFPGIRIKDMNQPDWYMKLNYSSLYIVELQGGKSKKLETNVDASDGSMIELANIKFSETGTLLSFTVGNYEKSSLHVVNTSSLQTKAFENAEYLHWIDGEDYTLSDAKGNLYFSRENSIIRINDKLEEKNLYTSKTKLDDFYLSKAGTGIMIFELVDDRHTARHLGK